MTLRVRITRRKSRGQDNIDRMTPRGPIRYEGWAAFAPEDPKLSRTTLSPTRAVLVLAATAYLAFLWFDAAGVRGALRFEPRPLRFFTQAACLFPRASQAAIDYRAEGYRCSDSTWVEIDTAPYFPIDADNKENRFTRAMHFFRQNRPTMRALDEWLVHRYNADASWHTMTSSAASDIGAIGGIRLSSVRIPIPKPGEPVTRFEHRPLDHYPSDQVKRWYHTPERMVVERCERLRSGGE
jgi:hypothetical protein